MVVEVLALMARRALRVVMVVVEAMIMEALLPLPQSLKHRATGMVIKDRAAQELEEVLVEMAPAGQATEVAAIIQGVAIVEQAPPHPLLVQMEQRQQLIILVVTTIHHSEPTELAVSAVVVVVVAAAAEPTTT